MKHIPRRIFTEEFKREAINLVTAQGLTMAEARRFKLIKEAEKSWRRIRGADKIELLLKCIVFKDGEAVRDDPSIQQNLAA
jgi:transposase-like protein